MSRPRRAPKKPTGPPITTTESAQLMQNIRTNPGKRISREQGTQAVRDFFTRDELCVEYKQVSLVCPNSKKRIVDPVRGVNCTHLECFDLGTYLELQVKNPYWECPRCKQRVEANDLRIDEYTSDVLRMELDHVRSIEVLGNGSYSLTDRTTDVDVPVALTINDETDETSLEENVVKTEEQLVVVPLKSLYGLDRQTKDLRRQLPEKKNSKKKSKTVDPADAAEALHDSIRNIIKQAKSPDLVASSTANCAIKATSHALLELVRISDEKAEKAEQRTRLAEAKLEDLKRWLEETRMRIHAFAGTYNISPTASSSEQLRQMNAPPKPPPRSSSLSSALGFTKRLHSVKEKTIAKPSRAPIPHLNRNSLRIRIVNKPTMPTKQSVFPIATSNGSRPPVRDVTTGTTSINGAAQRVPPAISVSQLPSNGASTREPATPVTPQVGSTTMPTKQSAFPSAASNGSRPPFSAAATATMSAQPSIDGAAQRMPPASSVPQLPSIRRTPTPVTSQHTQHSTAVDLANDPTMPDSITAFLRSLSPETMRFLNENVQQRSSSATMNSCVAPALANQVCDQMDQSSSNGATSSLGVPQQSATSLRHGVNTTQALNWFSESTSAHSGCTVSSPSEPYAAVSQPEAEA